MDTLFRSLDLIEPGDLVIYHGTLTDCHGLWLAVPCPCDLCRAMDRMGFADVRFALVDPWGELSGPVHARRASITRSAASA
ncbi:hypothetical protein RI578_06640 [Streptomyces sp. BB1-1-1]|uniref:hypothetical protein n=1 Tax=Streptomyces sp. BB1-1-1 TaxID=3074430 RepID=UPI002877FB69|nr:hypothetical protein [Streptomyces sp. BB1-1-1]WND33990.1 hypothetical protein RI578_06640 [Streptomyces sp. BB1-1-1]